MKVKFNLKSPNADFETFIICKVTYQSKQVRVYTDKKIHPLQWLPKEQRANKKLKTYAELNAYLTKLENFILKLELDWKNDKSSGKVTPIIPESLIKDGVRKFCEKYTIEEKQELLNNSFWGFYNDRLEMMNEGTRVSKKDNTPLAPKTIFQYHNLKRHLEAFQKSKNVVLEFETINMSFYEDFLRYTTVKKGLSPNTIGKLITLIKVLLREAYEKGISTNQIYLNSNFKSISSISDTVYLNNDEIKELQELDLSKRPSLERVRDAFLVGCFTGLRFSDLTRVRPRNIENGMIVITQQKTTYEVAIPMLKEVVEILARYEYSIPDISNKNYNEHLHELCSKCEILNKMVTTKAIRGGKVIETTQPKYELVTSHTARRSFATNEFKKGELTIGEIMVLTGHKTEKSFLRYIRETKKETALRIQEKFRLRELKQASLVEHHLKAV